MEDGFHSSSVNKKYKTRQFYTSLCIHMDLVHMVVSNLLLSSVNPKGESLKNVHAAHFHAVNVIGAEVHTNKHTLIIQGQTFL